MKKILPFIFLIAVISVVICVPVAGIAVAETEDTRALPVLMYHSVLKSKSGKYIVSPSQFEEDLISLQNAGYTTVFPSEVIAYCEGRGDLPEKPIMITFDDGHYNNMFYVLPILQKYSAKAEINIIGAFSEYSTTSGDDSNPNYSHLTWGQISELAAGGCFEIGNHTYNMHKYSPRFGIMPIKGETESEYLKALYGDIGRLQNKLEACIGYAPQVFAYPFGKYDAVVKASIIDMGFKMILTCNEGVGVVKYGDKNSILALKRINRSGQYSTDTVMEKVHGAK